MNEIQSDQELISAASMLVAQLSEIQQKLVKRGIESNHLNYEGGKMTVEFERVIRTKLKPG